MASGVKKVVLRCEEAEENGGHLGKSREQNDYPWNVFEQLEWIPWLRWNYFEALNVKNQANLERFQSPVRYA